MATAVQLQRIHLDADPALKLGVACMGNFDGVHRGHAALLEKTVAVSKQHQLPASVIVFEPQPRELLAPQATSIRLTNLREKYQLLAAYPLDYCACLRFTHAVAQLAPRAFIENVLIKQCGIQHLIVGEDFRFGYQRTGDIDLLTQYRRTHDFQVHVLENIEEHTGRISSTRIRDALVRGDLSYAHDLLGYPYFLAGRVRYGDQRGRQLGFPTANIALKRDVPPVHGVFAVYVHGLQSQPLPAVANVGKRPTVDGQTFLFEVHILDFNQVIYGAHIHVELLTQLRQEQRFASLDALKAQIQQDVKQARAYFSMQH